MHELSIARQILDIALAQAREHQAKRVTQFAIEMSAAVDESEDALRFHLEILTQGTPAEGAAFEITRVPSHWRCIKCGHEFVQEYPGQACPQCHSARVLPKLHDEFKLVSIELE